MRKCCGDTLVAILGGGMGCTALSGSLNLRPEYTVSTVLGCWDFVPYRELTACPIRDDFPCVLSHVDGLTTGRYETTRYHRTVGESVPSSSFHKTDGDRVQVVRQQTWSASSVQKRELMNFLAIYI